MGEPVMTSVRVAFVLIFAVLQLCTAEYVFYGLKMTLGNNLSLNPNRCHHPLITQFNQDMKPLMNLLEISFFSVYHVVVRRTKIVNRANKNWEHF